jgi:putative transposase
MRKSRFTESQIVRILKQVEGGRTATEVCREYGVSSATYYKWKSKYGGMEASDIRGRGLGSGHGKFVIILD